MNSPLFQEQLIHEEHDPLRLAAAALSGCGTKAGNGSWDLRVGGDARILSADGSDVALERLAVASPRTKSGRRSGATKSEFVTVASGTRVVVLAIDGDDARVEIKDGPSAGSIFWVECGRLESAVR